MILGHSLRMSKGTLLLRGSKFKSWNLFKLASCFSRPDLDKSKLAKGICLARKGRDKKVFI